MDTINLSLQGSGSGSVSLGVGNYFKGDKGDPGKTAYQVAVENGYTGNEQQWLQSIKGAAASISVGTVTKGTTASVTNSGTSSNAVFNFVLPKGDPANWEQFTAEEKASVIAGVTADGGNLVKTYDDNYVTSANDTPSYWAALGNPAFVRFGSGNPNASNWGFTSAFVVSFTRSNYVHQIALETSSNNAYIRKGSTSSGWSDGWKKLLTEKDVYSIPNGTYTLSRFNATGYMTSNATKVEFYIPLQLKGKNITISATGDVEFRSATDGIIVAAANHASATVSNAEFLQLSYGYRDRTESGVGVTIIAPKWYKYNSSVAATNNALVNVKFQGSLNVTVS